MEGRTLTNKYYVNDFLVNIETGEIVSSEKNQVVEPKVMALLNVLAQAPRQVYSAESLFESIWPNAIYSPNSVRRNISLLRQILNDDAKQIIKTHPKRGYSLEADVRFIDETPIQQKTTNNTRKRTKPYYVAFVLCTLFVFLFYLSSLENRITFTNLQPVTSSNQIERFMQVSPDGRYMAYIQTTDQIDKHQILLKNLKTGSVSTLSTIPRTYTYLTWDTENYGILYSVRDIDGISFGQLNLDNQERVVDEKTVFTRGDITWNSMFFVDDNQNMYYLANQNSSEHSRNVSLYRHDLTTGNSEVLIRPNDSYKPYKLSLSPDKTRLALVGFNLEGVSEVKLFDITSEKLTSVGLLDHNWYFLSWFENGKSLLLSNGSELKEFEFNGNVTKLNFKSFNFLVYPQVVGNELYFIEAKSDEDILIHKGGMLPSPQKLVDSNTVDKDPSISPDGQSIAYISMKNGLPQLFVKDIESGKEQLVFANTEREFALAKPIWDKVGKRIVSAINNRPFIVHLEQGHHTISWLTTVIGVPQAWYHNTDAILFVDKSQQGDNLVQYLVANEHVLDLNIKLKKEKVFLDQSDRRWFFNQGQVRNSHSDDEKLALLPKISAVFPSANGFYYLIRQNGKSRIEFFDFVNGTQKLSDRMDTFCSKHCEQITAIKDDIILLSERSDSADILKLSIH